MAFSQSSSAIVRNFQIIGHWPVQCYSYQTAPAIFSGDPMGADPSKGGPSMLPLHTPPTSLQCEQGAQGKVG